MASRKTLDYNFSQKHIDYIKKCRDNKFNIAEGAIRAGKTIDNVFAFYDFLKHTKDRIHLASAANLGNAKIIIGDSNGFGLANLFRGQCRYGKYLDNDALIIRGKSTNFQERIVVFIGGSKSNSFTKIRGYSLGGWIATEINLHHDSFIKEAINRTAKADKQRFFWDLNPDNPKAPIYTEYIDKYREMQANGLAFGGCNYEHFTLSDNATITEQRKAEIAAGYDPNSIWYQRDILGKRCVAEGLIYRQFADHMASGSDRYIVDKPKNIQEIYIGVDFGGNGSKHAFCATGFTFGFNEMIALMSERPDADTTPKQLDDLFIGFVTRVLDKYGRIDGIYCDSAEQVLIRGFQNALKVNGLGHIKIGNALKEKINERITFTNRMISQDRFKVVEKDCGSLVSALCGATWDPKNTTRDERLDDGTNDIDSLDAFEYTFERYMSLFIRRK